MGGRTSSVSRVMSGGTHRSTLVTVWAVRVTGIEFTNDFPIRENGNNHSNKAPDAIKLYPRSKRTSKAGGLVRYVVGWDWEGSDNLKRAACYHRQKPVSMRVRLHSSQPAPSPRTFTLPGRTDRVKRQAHRAYPWQCKSELALRLAGTDSGSHHRRCAAQRGLAIRSPT